MPLDGNSTDTVKIRPEHTLYYNTAEPKLVGTAKVTAPDTATYTAVSPTPLDVTSGDDVVVRASSKIAFNPGTDLVVTVNGTDPADSPLAGNVTIKEGSPEDQSYEVDASGTKFKTITGVSLTGGIAGDAFEIWILPDRANDVELCFHQGVSIGARSEVLQIPKRYEIDHTKRVRADRTLSITQWYQNNLTGLSVIEDREVTLVNTIRDDGGEVETEVWYFSKARLGVAREVPSDEQGQLTLTGEGFYAKRWAFS